MENNIFEPVVNKHGVFGLQVKNSCNCIIKGDNEKHMTLLAWRSPHATERQNHWLEKKLHRIYSRYYGKVMFSNYGLFWGDKEEKGVQQYGAKQHGSDSIKWLVLYFRHQWSTHGDTISSSQRTATGRFQNIRYYNKSNRPPLGNHQAKEEIANIKLSTHIAGIIYSAKLKMIPALFMPTLISLLKMDQLIKFPNHLRQHIFQFH